MKWRKAWDKWIELSEFIGNIVSRVVLTILYFSIFAIPSAFLTLASDRFGREVEKKEKSYYLEEKLKAESLEEAKGM